MVGNACFGGSKISITSCLIIIIAISFSYQYVLIVIVKIIFKRVNHLQEPKYLRTVMHD